MPERIPVHITLAIKRLVAPFQELQVVFHGMFPEPIDVFVVRDTRLPLWRPYLYGPAENAQVIVNPVVKDPGYDLFGMVFEIVEYGDGGIARDFRALLAELLISPKVLRRERL